jgi:hypothetical protein
MLGLGQSSAKFVPARPVGEFVYVPPWTLFISCSVTINDRVSGNPVVKMPVSTVTINDGVTAGALRFVMPLSVTGLIDSVSSSIVLKTTIPGAVGFRDSVSSVIGIKIFMPSTVTILDSVLGNGYIKDALMTGLLQDAETWVLNMETNAVTQYDRYGFNSFTFDGTRYLGFADDGVYELTGDTDDGLLIESTLQLAQTQFGTPNIKTVPYAWLGVNTLNAVFLKVNVDGQDYVYEAEAGRNALENQRVKLGRGLRSAFWTFTLTSLSAIELETITFQPIVLDRRI